MSERELMIVVLIAVAFFLMMLVGAILFLVWLFRSLKRHMERVKTQFGLPDQRELLRLLTPHDQKRHKRHFWGFLLLLAIAGLAASASATLLSSGERRFSWGTFAAAFFLAAASCLLFSMVVRLRSWLRARNRGVILLGPNPNGIERGWFVFIVIVYTLAIPMLVVDLVWLTRAPVWGAAFGLLIFLSILYTALTATIHGAILDDGLFAESLITPWSSIRWYRWTYNRKALLAQHDANLFLPGLVILTVPSEVAQEVDAVLKERLPGKEHPPLPPPFGIVIEQIPEAVETPMPEQN